MRTTSALRRLCGPTAPISRCTGRRGSGLPLFGPPSLVLLAGILPALLPLPFDGRDHRERHPATGLIEFQHPDLHDLADANEVMRVADELARQLADVHHPAVVKPDVDERTEVDHVEH